MKSREPITPAQQAAMIEFARQHPEGVPLRAMARFINRSPQATQYRYRLMIRDHPDLGLPPTLNKKAGIRRNLEVHAGRRNQESQEIDNTIAALRTPGQNVQSLADVAKAVQLNPQSLTLRVRRLKDEGILPQKPLRVRQRRGLTPQTQERIKRARELKAEHPDWTLAQIGDDPDVNMHPSNLSSYLRYGESAGANSRRRGKKAPEDTPTP